MGNLAPLTKSEVKQLVDTWYSKLDVHAPVEEVLPLLADKDLEMKFPEATLRGHAEFKEWYEGVIRKFFDEVHEMKKLDITTLSNQAEVQLVVNWQAHTWNPPEAKSKWLGFDAAQRWIVKRSADTQKPVYCDLYCRFTDPHGGICQSLRSCQTPRIDRSSSNLYGGGFHGGWKGRRGSATLST